MVSFFLVGWALPWREALWAVVVGAVVVRAGWWLFDDRCLLSILEARLRGGAVSFSTQPELAPEEKPNFIADTVEGLLGRPMPLHWVNNATYAVLWSAFSIAAVRLAIP